MDGDKKRFSRYEDCQDRIIIKILNRDRNADFLKTHPFIPAYQRLALVFSILDALGGKHIRHVAVDNILMDKIWGKPKEDVYWDALENTMRLFPPELHAIQDILAISIFYKKTDEETAKKMSEMGISMYVLTNTAKKNGATAMAYPGLLKKVGIVVKNDFIILPSSIHEVILVTGKSGREEFERFADMVKEVNREWLDEWDVLDDTVYFYSRDMDEVILPLDKEG